ncbi:NUDIX hydrolase [Oleisolibacter albus]|uniref:NUDIX hydrolase n=1 Tax=Oleisolibacter albus TaxID=2171757 RepID=UPI000DF46CD1|nr:NUDIX hydrolase [Oleisolibacter albus]
MTSVYACFAEPSLDVQLKVLLGQKNFLITRVDGKTLSKPLANNNAGQWVLPGGHVEEDKQMEPEAEFLTACLKQVKKEIHEELGIDPEAGEYFEPPTLESTRQYFPEDRSFCIFYIYTVGIGTLCAQINTNIQANDVEDNELNQVAVFPIGEAIGKFRTFQLPFPLATYFTKTQEIFPYENAEIIQACIPENVRRQCPQLEQMISARMADNADDMRTCVTTLYKKKETNLFNWIRTKANGPCDWFVTALNKAPLIP